jgi:hypothetical protein
VVCLVLGDSSLNIYSTFASFVLRGLLNNIICLSLTRPVHLFSLILLGPFAKYAKSNYYLVTSVGPHRTTLLPLDGYSWNFMFEYFRKNLPRKFDFHYNLTRIIDTLYKDLRKFLIISRRMHLRMRNVSDKNYRDNQNTGFIYFFTP